MSKYRAKPTVVDNNRFDSKAEAHYYMYLKSEQQKGNIINLELQPAFTLLDGFKKRGKTYKAIKYVADFKVTWQDGTTEIIDVKGVKTPVYNLKKSLFESKYPDLTIKEVRM
ncbi:DUF1064 domain-containing protein [Paenibacillus lutrae]|uniref:DUF1064 domain-containing protein n=1 Tax=Paenibacillus lutrae TaxID=2078573 RepID=A0A7X3JZW9_9BACL|nr:DUF1064 domain-containing protein [Paenibacillus lutrae]MVP00366.1 DUF1064 domain-containing protein [Paenibacillus lutrae]